MVNVFSMTRNNNKLLIWEKIVFKKLLILLALIPITFATEAQTISQEYAKVLAQEGNFEEAITVIDMVIKKNNPRASYYQDKANYQRELEDYKGVVETLSIGIQLMPDSVSLYDMRGALLEAFGFYKEAILDFTSGYDVAKENSVKSHLLANRGGTKQKIQDYEGAYSDLLISIKLDSSNLDALNNLAAVCDEVGKPDETLKYLEQIISTNPNYVPAYVNIGFKYQKQEYHEKAIKYFNKAIELDSTEAFAYSNRSFSKLKLKDLDGALKDINHSLRLIPSNSYAYKIKALIEIEKGNLKEACEALDSAVTLGYLQQFGKEVEELIIKYCK